MTPAQSHGDTPQHEAHLRGPEHIVWMNRPEPESNGSLSTGHQQKDCRQVDDGEGRGDRHRERTDAT